MFSLLLAAAIAVWFALLCPLALRSLEVDVPALDAPLRVPLLLVIVFSLLPLVFNVPREDGTAVLDQGLSASNLLSVALTGATGLYLVYRALIDRRLLLVPLALPYLPITLLLALDILSAAWSIVPTYTIYRAVELAVFSLATIAIFDRSDIGRRLPDLLAFATLAWLAAVSPDIVLSLSRGIVFSAAKNNMMPLVCAGLLLFAAFEPACRRRAPYLLLGFAGFVMAGSAASTGALLASVVPAALIASRHLGTRTVGFVLAIAAVLVFVVLMLGLSNVPVLLDLASAVMQKPAVELANATGRTAFWPTFIEATRDHVVGSGFSAADRFVQLLVPTDELAADIGRQGIHLSSAHNMFLSAWAGTGVIGLGFCVVVLGTAVAWGLKLDRPGRRFVIALVLMLILNGMTTPGIFQDWSVNNLVFLAALAFARVGALQRSDTAPHGAAGRWGRSSARPRPRLAG